MAQVNKQPPAASPAIRLVLTRQFVARIIISSMSSAAGLISFMLTGPVMGRIAAVDPALEGVYLALVVGWCWSLARMWSLTCQARHRQKTASTPNQIQQKGEICHATELRKDVRLQDSELAGPGGKFH